MAGSSLEWSYSQRNISPYPFNFPIYMYKYCSMQVQRCYIEVLRNVSFIQIVCNDLHIEVLSYVRKELSYVREALSYVRDGMSYV